MKIKFTANKIAYESNVGENYNMIGFSDNGDDPNQYVIIQKAIAFDPQDIELGMDSYYFEYIDQSNSGYDICRNASANKNSILFELKENAIEGIESIEIVIENSHTIENWEEFKSVFDEIFSDI